MKKLITLLLIISYSTIVNSQCKIEIQPKEKFDEFDKQVSCEINYRFNISDLVIPFFKLSWRDTYYVKKKDWYIGSDSSVYEGKDYEFQSYAYGKNAFNIIIGCKNSYKFLSEKRDRVEWVKYLKKKINEPIGFSYIHFIAYNGDDIKMYVSKYGPCESLYEHTIVLNSYKYPRTIDHYNWLINHQIKKIRFSNGSSNLDINIPNINKNVFKHYIQCLENYKKTVEQKYSN